MTEHLRAFLVAIGLSCAVAGGVLLPVATHRLVDSASWYAGPEATEDKQWHQETYDHARQQQNQNSDFPTAASYKFIGKEHVDPKSCYYDEKEGECAARIVQQRVASLSVLLTYATVIQIVISVCVSIGTLVLVGRQASISREQAKIMSGQLVAEKGVLALLRIDLAKLDASQPNQAGVIPPTVPPDDVVPLVTVANFGRTHLRITQGSLAWDICKVPPPTPIYGDLNGTNFLIIAGQLHPAFNISRKGIKITDKDRDAIASGCSSLWLWGFLTFQDFLENTYDAGFVAHWEALRTDGVAPRGFVVEGPPSYNYEYQRPPDAPRTGLPPHLPAI